MQLAEDEDIVPLVDRLPVLKLRFQDPDALVEHSRNFDGYIRASRTVYISRRRLATDGPLFNRNFNFDFPSDRQNAPNRRRTISVRPFLLLQRASLRGAANVGADRVARYHQFNAAVLLPACGVLV